VEQPRLVAPVAALPDAPRIAQAAAKPVDLPPPNRPQPRAFTPPVETKPAAAKPVLSAAPELTIALDRPQTPNSVLPPMQAARKSFIPPVEAPRVPTPQTANLPAAPQLEANTQASPPALAGVPMARAVRAFNAPASKTAAPAEPMDLPAAPRLEIQEAAAAPNLPVTPMARPLRSFTAPAAKAPPANTTAASSLADAPAISTTSRPNQPAFAIVGLNPTQRMEIAAPKASQSAGFSAGPMPRPDGGDSSADGGQLSVPGLFVRGGARDPQPTLVAALEPPTSRRNLAAAVRSVNTTKGPDSTVPLATRSTAPDPRLSGRVVYTVAIQMPNVTSYSGSWIVWFAEREPVPGEALPTMRAPSPLRKVDPKYIPAAADEKVEGKVRLAAVIRRDGRVEAVELLQHLDTRLDQSSQEALAKWEFEPASRNGVPIDVDAVFEIPFHVAPKLPK
jgi:TonB family protein